MIATLVFVVAVPLSVEFLGALYAVYDAWRHAESRAAALERLAVPLTLWGALWWLGGVEAWHLLLAALLVVLACHIVVFYGTRWLLERPSAQTIAVDTDSDDA